MLHNIKVVTTDRKKRFKKFKLQFHTPSTFDHNMIIFKVASITCLTLSVLALSVLSSTVR